MNVIKCDPRARARCQFRDVCDEADANFLEGSLCHQFNENVLAGEVITRGDVFRGMSDEELAEAIFEMWKSGESIGANWCDGSAGCIDEDEEIHCEPEKHKACIVRWLREPAEEGDHGKM